MKAKPGNHRGEVVLELNDRDETILDSGSQGAVESPFQIKEILVPVDFSDCSKKALRYAMPLAKQHHASITLLYVVPPPSFPMGEYGGVEYGALLADERVGAEKQLTSMAAEEVNAEAEVKTVVGSGAPAVEIVGLAATLPADIIVISTHGRTGLKHAFLGSVAEHVIRNAPCPVLVVREKEHEILAQ